jgi:hypothetical protein
MNDEKYAKYKPVFLVLALLIALLEIPGGLDIRNRPYDGYRIDSNSMVITVLPDSPAQRAGLMVGDHLISVAGVDARNQEVLDRQPRAKIGETRVLVVERQGRNVNLDLTYSELPKQDLLTAFLRIPIVFCFLIFGVGAYLRVQNQNTTLLALAGLSFGFSFLNKPYFASDTLSSVLGAVGFASVLFGLVWLLHFFMGFPKPKAFLARKRAKLWLYGPAALVIVLLLCALVFGPITTGVFGTAANLIGFLIFGGYLVLSFVMMVHSWIKATPQERTANGLNFMLLGTLIGIAAFIIPAIVWFAAPNIALPGAGFLSLAVVLVPFALSQAALKKARCLV